MEKSQPMDMYFGTDGMTLMVINLLEEAVEKGAVCTVHAKDIETMHKRSSLHKVENVTAL